MRRFVSGATLSSSALLAALLLAAGHVGAASPPRIEQREPTTEERNSFDAFFSRHTAHGANGAPSLFAPAFDIQRRRGEPWQVLASVDSAPRHVGPDLCRQIRSTFIYNTKAPKDERWSVSAAAPAWYVWLAQPNTICTTARYTVRMEPAVPVADVTELIRQHRELLIRARLLFAGNSQCARQRALTFRLSAIEPAPATPGAPVMFGMVFESDRDTIAKVAVRKSRGEYVAWNVSCPA